jgi:hypothetical protein
VVAGLVVPARARLTPGILLYGLIYVASGKSLRTCLSGCTIKWKGEAGRFQIIGYRELAIDSIGRIFNSVPWIKTVYLNR